MALKPYWLGDTSALARLSNPVTWERLHPLLEAGLVARCAISDLEVGFASPSPEVHALTRAARAGWPFVPVDQHTVDRAIDVQHALGARSQQRAAKIPALLIAAAAEIHGLVVLHYDHDFDVIADVTGQRVESVEDAHGVP